MSTRTLSFAAVLLAAVALAGCGGSSSSPTPAPASGATVNATSVGTVGTVLVAGSNGHTLYEFANDVNGSGTSACTGGCATTWPPLAAPATGSPTGGSGVTGTFATITRSDGIVQVTYNGSPLYVYSGDSAAGQSNGNYPKWSPAKP